MWHVSDKAFWVRGAGLGENLLSCGQDRGRLAIVDHVGGEQCDTGMTVLEVVPVKEWATECPTILQGAEAFRKLRLIFERLSIKIYTHDRRIDRR